MIKITLDLMNTTFEKYKSELDKRNTNISILKATNQKQDPEADDVDRIAGLYGIFISYYFTINQQVDVKKMVEDTKEDEDLINHCSEENYRRIVKAMEENRMSTIYLDKTLIKLYNAFIKFFNSQQIIHLINIFIGNLIINHRMNVMPEGQLSNLTIEVNGKVGCIFANEVDSVKAYDTGTLAIINTINQYIDDFRSNHRRVTNMANTYNLVHNALDHNIDIPIMTIPEGWHTYFTDEILHNLYQIVYNNQLAKNAKLDLSLMKFSNTSNQDQLNKILHRYHLSLEMFMNKELIIKYCNIKNVGLILHELKVAGINLDYCASNGLEYVLISSTPEIVSDIMRHVANGVITKGFVESNLGIFLNVEAYSYYLNQEILIPKPLYETVSNNIAVYKAKKTDFNSEAYNEENLLMNPLIVNQTAELMTKYNVQNIEILSNPAIFDLIDLLIEKGFDVNDIDFSNIEKNDVKLIGKRIVVACLVDLSVIKGNKLTNEIVTGHRFIVGDDKLDDYIIDETESSISPDLQSILNTDNRLNIDGDSNQTETIKKLDQTIINLEGNYEFDSLIISRNKVLRNLSSIMKHNPDYSGSLLPAIIYNSFLSQDDIEIINKYLKPIVFEKDDK